MQRFKRMARAAVVADNDQMRDQSRRDPKVRDRAFNKLLSSFRWAVDRAGILSDVSQSIAYQKPSDQRRAERRKRDLDRRRSGVNQDGPQSPRGTRKSR
jgi:ribosomal protein S21